VSLVHTTETQARPNSQCDQFQNAKTAIEDTATMQYFGG
jgi:hypothetical protein